MAKSKTLLGIKANEYKFDQDIEICGVKGKSRKAISYAEKRDMASEWFDLAYFIDAEHGILLEKIDYSPIELYVVLKHYTTINVDGLLEDDALIRVYDSVSKDQVWKDFHGEIQDDLRMVRCLMDVTAEAFEDSIKASYDPMKRLFSLLQSIPTTDEMGEVAKDSAALNSYLVEIMRKARKQDAENGVVQKVDVGDNKILNFAKKN